MQSNQAIPQLPTTLPAFIWHYLKNEKKYLIGDIFVALIWALEMSLSPYLLKVIINTVVYIHNKNQMITLILVPACLYVAMSFLVNMVFRLFDYINLRLYPALKSAVNRDMFIYLSHHSHNFLQNQFAGTLTKKIYDMAAYVDQIVDIINVWFYPRIMAIIIATASLCIFVSPIFGIILLSWAVLFIYFSYYIARKSEKYARQTAEASSTLGGTLADSIANMMTVKLFANIPYEVNRVETDIETLVSKDRALQWHMLKFGFIQGLLVTLLIGTMLAALIWGNYHGTISPGDFAFVLMLSISFVMSIYEIGQQMLKFSKVVGICNSALSFIRIPHEIVDVKNASVLTLHAGKIQFKQVDFQYDNTCASLFHDLTLTIHPGEKVGLVGYSGGGKSSFVKLILRLMDVESGQITIDDQDIKTVTQDSLRKQIAIIPQDPELFHRTIMENIRFARPEASDSEVEMAAMQAKCHEFISALPSKYQSVVGERGIKLSGGQKQRIAIARAFLKNAPILILDEATSSLDSATESQIHESLHLLMRDKTTIVIAHRLSTLRDMSRILFFDQGKIIEDDTLKALLRNPNSHFYQLWQMQHHGFIV